MSRLKTILFQRTACPFCEGFNHRCVSTKKRGFFKVRIHECTCGERFRTRESLAEEATAS